MTIAYCVVAHTRPSQCVRLVRCLLDDDPVCQVLLHYDQRSIPPDLSQVAHPRVRLMAERPVHWGGPELPAVFVEMFRLALEVGCSYGVMLSGQDYPLRSVSDLEVTLLSYDVWADVRPLVARDGSCAWEEGRRRYSYRWWHLYEPNKLVRGVERRLAKVLGAQISRTELPLPYLVFTRAPGEVWWGVRAQGPGIPVHFGEAWMSLSAPAMAAICSSPHRVMSFFRHVQVPDEAWFHTILANTTALTFAPGYDRYIRRTEGSPHPVVLTSQDIDSMMASGAHFARKFDELIDSSVLDELDQLSKAK
jgi:hypothetical protein